MQRNAAALRLTAARRLHYIVWPRSVSPFGWTGYGHTPVRGIGRDWDRNGTAKIRVGIGSGCTTFSEGLAAHRKCTRIRQTLILDADVTTLSREKLACIACGEVAHAEIRMTDINNSALR